MQGVLVVSKVSAVVFFVFVVVFIAGTTPVLRARRRALLQLLGKRQVWAPRQSKIRGISTSPVETDCPSGKLRKSVCAEPAFQQPPFSAERWCRNEIGLL